jgi:predicted HD phosphohydrolase
MTTVIEQIESLFAEHGGIVHNGPQVDPVSALSHALQCAQLAEWAGVEGPLVAAALLHDIGHLVDRPAPGRPAAARVPHELRALELLGGGFGPEVLEPIRLHVQAKRYLVTTEPTYAALLTPTSARSLAEEQGGPMSAAEVQAFEQLPYATDAVQLRRWDDQAWESGKRTPTLGYYLGVLDEVMQRPFTDSKMGIGSVSVV